MAYNTVAIEKDVNGKPIPQYYNHSTDMYEVLEGRNGANRVELFDADGNPVDLAALVASIITALGQVKVAESELPIGAATAGKQDEIKTALEAVATLFSGTNNIGKVTLDGSTMEYYGKSDDEKPIPDAIGSTFFEIDTKTVYMWDGTDWVVI